jgi:signal transduction histidine kinase
LTDAQLIRIGRTIAAVAVVLAVGGLIAAISLGRWQSAVNTVTPINASVGVGFGALAWTVLPKQPRNRSVWAYNVAAFFGGLYSTALVPLVLAIPPDVEASADALVPADLEWSAAIAATILAAGWIPSFLLPLTIGLLLFPDGQVPSPRWRWALRFQTTTLGLAFLLACAANNPRSTLPIPTPGGTLGDLAEIAILLALLSSLLGIASLVVRHRHGDAIIRHQIRWIAAGGAFVVVGELALRLVAGGDSGDVGPTIQILINLVPLLLLIAAFWVAITRYRLYEIDAIISKSVTYFGLAVVIVGLYAAVVVGPLVILGASDEGGPGLVLPIVASAMVAVLFEPVRSRLQRAANRLVYGDRVSPYELLSRVTSSLSDAAAGDGIGDLAELLARGTGAERAVVWLASGEMLQVGGAFPDAGEFAVGAVAVDDLVDDELTESRRVLHRGELFGALTVVKPHNDPITPNDGELLSDVAAGSGLLLRNIGLNRQLEQRAADVRASRRRLIAAQDAERHRLERDLHDGAQQQVVALKVKLGIARTIAEREDADEIVARVTALAEETQQAVDALRAVAHGIYPPLLESEGLASALRAVERTSPIGLDLSVDGVGRYGRDAEATVYFCVLETLERARMSGASDVRVAIVASGADLLVQLDVGDCTPEPELTSVTDRIDAYGGTTAVERGSHGGIVITSTLPVSETMLEPA